MKKIRVTSILFLLLSSLFLRPAIAQEDNSDLGVLPEQIDGGPPRQMMTRYLKNLAYEAFQRRRSEREKLKTTEQCRDYQQQMRAAFIERLGGFPERTPLNARVVGKLDGDGFHVEKLIYESQPRHYVTAALFLPKTKSPYPAVLVPCGHSSSGKVANQKVCILLAKHGIAALCYDPIGQGERYQFLDSQGKPRFRPTREHTLMGAGCIPLGRNTATYRIWDGMRSLDYLTSRKDIDPQRLGVTGCSGGGTLSSYLMALDPRIVSAAPSCYLTSFRRLIDTIGPQDAEQNIFGQIALGMDHADYVMMRAPKPTLILASTHDFFDIQGTWDTFRQAKQFYTRLGFGQRVGLIETDARHGYPQPQREAMLRWMQRWLADVDAAAEEPELKTFSAEELRCSPSGQVMTIEGARSVTDLNVALNKQYAQRRQELWKAENRQQALAEVRRISGIRNLENLSRPEVKSLGQLKRSDAKIEKLTLSPEPGIVLPALLFHPAKPNGRRTLYLHGEGKHVDAGKGGAIDKLVEKGHLVLAVDLRGCGETGGSNQGQWGGNWNDIFLSYLLGRSLVGMRGEDALTAARFLAEYNSADKPVPVGLVAIGATGPAALHAAALEQQIFAGDVFLKNTPTSWSVAVQYPAAGGHLAHVIHGALRSYDLIDLRKTLPRVVVEIVKE